MENKSDLQKYFEQVIADGLAKLAGGKNATNNKN